MAVDREAFGPAFLWTSEWNPVTNHFGALPMIYGTVVSSSIAIVLAGFVGIHGGGLSRRFRAALAEPAACVHDRVAGGGAERRLRAVGPVRPRAVHAHDVGPFLQKALGFIADLFGTDLRSRASLRPASCLAIMIVPTVTAISRDVIAAMSRASRRRRWRSGRRAGRRCEWSLPAARTGIFGACILALGRALGETIAATMVIGNRPAISASLFAPSYTLASVIANEFTEATTRSVLSALIELGLLLFVVSLIVNGLRATADLDGVRPGGRPLS